MQLEVTRNFTQSQDGTYEHTSDTSSTSYCVMNSQDHSSLHFQTALQTSVRPIRPSQLKTYLKCGKCVYNYVDCGSIINESENVIIFSWPLAPPHRSPFIDTSDASKGILYWCVNIIVYVKNCHYLFYICFFILVCAMWGPSKQIRPMWFSTLVQIFMHVPSYTSLIRLMSFFLCRFPFTTTSL